MEGLIIISIAAIAGIVIVFISDHNKKQMRHTHK